MKKKEMLEDPLIIELSKEAKERLEELRRSGMFGDTPEEVAKHLLLTAIREAYLCEEY